MDIRDRFVKTVNKVFGYRSTGTFSFGSFGSMDSMTKRQILQQFTRYTYIAASKIASESAMVNVFAEKVNADGSYKNVIHPLVQQLENPNSYQSKYQFLALHFVFMKMAGESYWYTAPRQLSRKPTGFYLISPDRIEPVVGEDEETGTPKMLGYVYTKEDGTRLTFEPWEIIPHITPNPNNPFRGLSAPEAALIFIETERLGSEFTYSTLNNAGRPSGIVKVKGAMDQKAWEQMKREFQTRFTGPTNAGKAMLMRNADEVDFIKMGVGLDDFAMKELKDMTRDDIMTMFGVSKPMLGITDDVNRANAEAARVIFMENVVKPEMFRLVDALQKFGMPLYGQNNGVRLGFDDPTPLDREMALKEHSEGFGKWLTVNDVRRDEGLKEVVGGDVLYQPINVVPTVTVKQLAAPVKKELSPEEVKENEYTRKEAFRKSVYGIQESWVDKTTKAVQKVFNQQEVIVLDKVGTAARDYKSKAFDDKFPTEDESVKLWVAGLLPVLTELYREEGNVAMDFVGSTDPFILTPDLERTLVERIRKFAKGVDETTIQKLAASYQEGINNGESIAKIKKRIREVYTEANDSRATVIARTESIHAANAATIEGYKQTGFITGKEWFAEPSACAFCKQLDGKIISLNSEFAPLGGEIVTEDGKVMPVNYEAISYPPAHPQCKCTTIGIVGSARNRNTGDIPVAVKELELELREKELELEKKQLIEERNKITQAVKLLEEANGQED